jgi:hypothetical protein
MDREFQTRNEQVVGSIPTIGSTKQQLKGGFSDEGKPPF